MVALADVLALGAGSAGTGTGDRFSAPGREGHRHLFGGLVVAQALRAAQHTVDDEQQVHALHAHFVRAGRGDQPLELDVERTRNGTSFSTRRVVAHQRDHVVLVLSASFHCVEPGPEYAPAPDARPLPPDGLGPGRYDSDMFDCRDVPFAEGDLHRLMWCRSREPVPADEALHRAALTMASDHGPTRAARQPHLHRAGVDQRMSVSLDHSVWFHRAPRVDEWFLVTFVPQWTGAGRGLAHGTVRTSEGDLVASVAQEVLLRMD